MVTVELQTLIARLGTGARRSLETAVASAMSRSHYNCEIEHWLIKLAEPADNDLAAIFRQYEVDVSRLVADLTRALDGFKTGNSRPPALAPDVVRLLREAWVVASLQFGTHSIRSGHLLLALLQDDVLAPQAKAMSGQFARISVETLRRDFDKITVSGAEATPSAATGNGAPPSPPAASAAGGALDLYTVDLTARARAGKIDPVLGRDPEIRQIVDILTRRRQNNPILTGEAGVGKTAVVEGFALRIAAGDVPPALRDVTLRTLDLGLLQAGAGMKGEFENRLKGVLDAVKASPKPIIMFIDEAHTLIGAGGQAGQNDAANLLKPALARGEMRTIAATTWAEYKKYFERDPALTRRFQVVKVEEPDQSTAVDMMRGLVATLESHHKVRVLSEAVEEAVRLSRRYIPSRQLPDKAVSLLDTACARVAMSRSATPAPLEDVRRSLMLLDTDVAILEREAAIGADHGERLTALADRRSALTAELAALEERLAAESDLVAAILALHDKLTLAHDNGEDAQDGQTLRRELAALEDRLKSLQGEAPLLKVTVDGQAVAEVVANWTGIPVGRMVSDEIRTVLSLKQRLEERVIGQSHALDAIAQTMWTTRAGLADPRKPLGVFLMVGTSGTGKTETALALADLLYGGEQNLTVINMSEFKEEHKVSMLVGSPPGYVGYGEGGVLTEAVRRKPYSVILLDEIEKAHPGVQDIFFQVFDKGMLRDGEGRDIDFKNTVIIMTSNAGTELIHKLCADPETMPDAAGLAEALRPELLKWFKPAFLGRTSLVPYFPLGDEVIRKIVGLQLRRIGDRFVAAYRAEPQWDAALVDSIAARCTEVESGARNIEHILSRSLLPDLSALLLARIAEGRPVGRVRIGLGEDGAFAFDLD